MGLLDLFEKEEKPIAPTKDKTIQALDQESLASVLKCFDRISKKFASLKKEYSAALSQAFMDLKERLSKLHENHKEMPQDFEAFVAVEDLLSQVLLSFEKQKRYQDLVYSEQFLAETKLLVQAMEDSAPEFSDSEYFQTYAIYLFAHCEEEQLKKDHNDISSSLNFFQEQYDKHPTEELENRLNEMKLVEKETMLKLGDYNAIEKSLRWELSDKKREIHKALREQIEN